MEAVLAPLLQCVKIGPARSVWAQVKLTKTGPPPLTDTVAKAPTAPVPGVFYIRIIADGNWSIDMQPL